MNRRKFIHTISICTVSTALFGAPKKNSEKLKLTNVEIKVGLKKPMKFLHVTDSHLITWDERSPKQEDIYKKRIKVFSLSRKRWEMTLAYAKENNLPILNTGDVFDFTTPASIEFLKNEVLPNTRIYAVGNHEFSRYCGSQKEVEHDAETVNAMQSAVSYDIGFSSHIIGGVNFVAIDDVTYQFTQSQVEKLNDEIKKGLPIIAMFHIPIYSEKFFKIVFEANANNPRRPRKVAAINGIPDDKLAMCDPKFRQNKKPNKATKEMTKILSTHPLIKGIICGHVHKNITDTLPNGAVITCSEGGYKGWAQVITIS